MTADTYRNPAAEHTDDDPPTVSVLPEELSNRIAAGEVVERPSSVVKELVENSLDAGSSRLEIAIESGGRDRIRVVDDGCGMEREDLLRAVERHATSKIDGPDDLDAIGTLGFRGEAIPSIAAVSRMEIQSKPHGDLGGSRLTIEGGEIEEVEEVGMRAGTEVDVEDLFFNTPARRKFMKTARTESRRVTKMITRMALSRPDVRFVLERDGKVGLDLSQVDDVKKRVLEVMGRDVHDALYPTYEYPEINGVVARGYFSEPSHTQRTSKNIYAYVNGRYVDDSTIHAAIQKAYGNLLDSGRYPSVVLFIEVPFELVDVNVHPMKTEVRFHDTQPVFRSVYHAISDALAESPWLDGEEARVYELEEREQEDSEGGDSGEHAGGASGESESEGTTSAVHPAQDSVEPLNARHQRRSEQQSSGPRRTRPNTASSDASDGEVASPFYEDRSEDDGQQGFSARDVAPLQEPPRTRPGQSGEAPPEVDGESNEGEDDAYFSTLRVLGQFKRAYIVCEDASGLVVIDQHAAHERIGFERLRHLYHHEHKETQSLLFGQRIELDAVQAECLDEHLDFFEEAGFEIRSFGGQSYAIKSVPAVLEDADHEALVRDALAELEEMGRTERVEEAVESVLSRMACHSVVRGPTDLTDEECESLLERMDEIDFRANCPHGRPVYYRISLTELEKSFDRT